MPGTVCREARDEARHVDGAVIHPAAFGAPGGLAHQPVHQRLLAANPVGEVLDPGVVVEAGASQPRQRRGVDGGVAALEQRRL